MGEISIMDEPLVSVIIPFYSGVNWLIEAINSVLNQTYKELEIFVINDGSLDNIDYVARKYASSVKIINKKNEGPASARNIGIEKSKGKYIAFLDSDDLWLPDKLTKQIYEMESKNYYWSQHSYEIFWENKQKSKIVNTQNYTGIVYWDCFISFKVQTSCVVVLRSVLIENCIRFPIEKRYGEDGNFYRQIAMKYPLGYVEGIYTRFRMRGSNAGFQAKVQINSRADTWKDINRDRNVLKDLPVPVILAYKTSSALNNIVNFFDKYSNNQSLIELISKTLYIFPYVIFKYYAKK
jgi:glycosyltransferase involved in cell wall biosynthesis